MLTMTDLSIDGYERVIHATSDTTGLDGYFAVHSTALGPALGGCRFWTYPTTDDALQDALRLSQGMTMKNALAGLKLGGGKSVINLANTTKTDALLEEIGEVVESLAGTYFIAEDVGSSLADMQKIREKTQWVGSLTSGDPSQATAYGVFRGILACMDYLGEPLKNSKVLIEGMGNVGFYLAGFLIERGAVVYATDISDKAQIRAKTAYAEKVIWVDTADISDQSFTIWSPCALGGVINEKDFGRVRSKIICGSANNQLSTPLMGYMLSHHGILYAPDYLVNAGGVINCASEFEGEYRPFVVASRIDHIYSRCMEIFEAHKAQNLPTNYVADSLALKRLKV